MTRLPAARRRKGLRLVPVLALSLLLSACASNAPQDTLKPEGPYARKIDHLFNPVFLIAVAVFCLVQGLVLFAIVKFRRRPGDEDFPEQLHGNTRLELGWTILPAIILGAVGVFTVPVIFDLSEVPKNALQVEVTGQKYWWSYTYQAQSKFGISDPIITANELHIPAGVPVALKLDSKDVIHSFWAPRLNGKKDVVPGRVHDWKLEADHPGVYSGQCAEFCGISHANMRLKVVAHDKAGWADWVAHMQTKPTKPTSGLAAEGYDLFAQKGCSGCHQVDGEYQTVAADSPSAPNLTHLFSRDCFAGCIYNLDDRNEVEAWLRNPQRKAGSLMRIGQLSEAEIDRLYAYLETLK
ncbi:MAG: cytochrome c oxidase subunit II [Acidobacteria bacterium]|nr:cytochrome c oxidase subunit II [Acidobacteriota bacterium]